MCALSIPRLLKCALGHSSIYIECALVRPHSLTVCARSIPINLECALSQSLFTYSVRSVNFLLAFDQFFLLIGEVDELVERLLVDVAVFLQLLVTLLQLLKQLQPQQSVTSTAGKLRKSTK